MGKSTLRMPHGEAMSPTTFTDTYAEQHKTAKVMFNSTIKGEYPTRDSGYIGYSLIYLSLVTTVCQRSDNRTHRASQIFIGEELSPKVIGRDRIDGSHLKALNQSLLVFGLSVKRFDGKEFVLKYKYGTARPIKLSSEEDLPEDILFALEELNDKTTINPAKGTIVETVDEFVGPLLK